MEFDDRRPIYLQISESISKDIIANKLKPGERIRSIRELAIKFKVNPNTVQRAMIELEHIGVVYGEGTMGKFVTNDIRIIDDIKEKYLKEKVSEFLESMEQIGYGKNDVVLLLSNDNI